MRSGDEKCNLYMYYSVRGCLDLKFFGVRQAWKRLGTDGKDVCCADQPNENYMRVAIKIDLKILNT